MNQHHELVADVSAGSALARRPAMLFCVVLMLGTLAVCGAVDTFAPIGKEPLAGLQGELEEESRLKAQFADGTRMRLLESDLKRSSRVRSWVLQPWAALLYAFGGSLRPETVVGRDDWLFLRERAQPRRIVAASALDETAAVFAALARRCLAAGTRLVLAPVPAKSVVHPEFLPEGFVVDQDDYDRLVRSLRQRGLAVADLRAALKSANGQTYLRSDTHWTPFGCRIAAECIAETAGMSVAPAQRPGRLVQGGSVGDLGDLLALSGLRQERVLEGGFTASLLSLAGKNHAVASERIDFGSEAPKAPDLRHPWMLIGTSYSLSAHFQDCLTNAAAERPLVRALYAVDAERMVRQFAEDLELASAHGLRPRVAVLEFLSTDILNRERPARDLRRSLSSVPASEYTPLPPEWGIAPARDSKLKPGTLTMDGKWIAAWLPRGALLHPADGCLAWQLDGEVLSGACRVSVRCGEQSVTLAWTSGTPSLLIPLIAAAPCEGARIALQGEPGTRVRIDALRLMTVMSPAAQVATVGPLTSAQQGFTQEITLPAESAAMALTLVELDISGTRPASLSVNCGEFTAEFDKPVPAARMLIPVPQQGPGSIVIGGAGTAPRRLVRRAGVLIQSGR